MDGCNQLKNDQSICIEHGNEVHCCCSSNKLSTEICSENERKLLLSIYQKKEKNFYIFLGFICCSFMALIMYNLYRLSFKKLEESSYKITEKYCKKITFFFFFKILNLSIITFLIYLPIEKTCMKHQKGNFNLKSQFWYQIMEMKIETSLFFVGTFVFGLFEISLFLFSMTKKEFNKTALICIEIFTILIFILIEYDPIIQSYYLYLMEKEEEEYCKFGKYIWILLSIHILMFLFIIQLIIFTFWLNQFEENQLLIENFFDLSENNDQISTKQTSTTTTTENEKEKEKIELFDEEISFNPTPFYISKNGSSVLNICNNNKKNWITLRALLSTTGFYKLYPTKFFIPPMKQISIEVAQLNNCQSILSQHNILFQWFSLGSDPPTRDLNMIWNKPYIVPQHLWQYFVLPIYLDESSD